MRTITVKVSEDGYKIWTSLTGVYRNWSKGHGAEVPQRELETALMMDMLRNFTEKVAGDIIHLAEHPEDCVPGEMN